MKILEAGLKTFKWQGGTIHQVLEEVGKHSILIKDVYSYGYRDGYELGLEQNVEDFQVPVNSWCDYDVDCFCSFIKGLLSGIAEVEYNNIWLKKRGY